MADVSGPTQIDYDKAGSAEKSWDGRPSLARVIRVLLWTAPLVGSLLFGFWASRTYSHDRLGLNVWVWWLGLATLATALLRILEQVTRRLTPLTLLLRLSLIFPDEAPSRFKAALRNGTTTSTKKRIKAIQEGGGALDGDDSVAAQMLDLIGMLSKHDKMTRGHAERVRGYTDLLAEELDLNETDAGKLRWAALLHDMGKLEVPTEILNKPGKPNDEEWATLKGHPAAANKHLEPIAEWLGEWRHAADGHHERWDGNGYPAGLAGKDIPYAARIVAVADAYDVMTSTRSYKKPLPPEIARQEIANNAGSQFDPEVARAFLNIGLGDLRRATGPFAWIASLPGLRNLPLANTVTPAATNIVATASAVVTAAVGVVAAAPPSLPQPVTASPAPIVAEPELAFTEPEPVATTAVATTTPPTSAPTTLPANQAPIAGDLSFVLDDGSTATLSLPGSSAAAGVFLLDGSDPDGDPLSIVVDDEAVGGEISQSGDSVVFVHEAGALSASFEYAVFDGDLYSDPATVTFDVVVPQTVTTALPATTSSTTTIAPTTSTTTTTTTSTTSTTTTTTVFVNLPPTVSSPVGWTVAENASGISVGVLSATDPEGGSILFGITGGADANRFEIDPSTGEVSLKPGVALDYETRTTASLQISATDAQGLTSVVGAVIAVEPQNEAPSSTDESVGLHEDDPVGTALVQVKVDDPDAGDTHSFLIVGGNQDHDGDGIKPFSIDADGVVRVADTDDDIDFGIDGQSFTLLVGIGDSGGLTALSQVDVAVQTRHTLSPWAHLVTINEMNPTSKEFVELINQTGAPIDMSGWRITDGDVVANDLDLNPSWRVDTVLPTGTMLPANGRGLIADVLPLFLGATGADIEVAGGWGNRFSPAGDEIYIWDADGSLVAFMSWGDPNHTNNRNDTPPIRLWNLWDDTYELGLTAPGETRSISLAIDSGDPYDSACWEPTGSGEAVGRCPGATQTVNATPTFGFSYSAGLPNDVFTGPEPADLQLSVHEDVANGTVITTVDFNDPDSTTFTTWIRNGNIDADGDGSRPFWLMPTGELRVVDTDDIDFGVAGQTFLLDAIVTDESSTRSSFEIEVLVESRHKKSNMVGTVLITEVNWQNQHLANIQDEFVEIENVGSVPVDISSWQLADHDVVLAESELHQLSFTVPTAQILYPEQRAVLWLGLAGEADSDASGANSVFSTGGSAALYHDGDDVWLYDSAGAVVAYVAWGDENLPLSELGDRPPIEAYGLWDPTYESALDTSAVGYAQSIALAVDGDSSAAVNSACWEPTGTGEAQPRCASAVHTTFDSDESTVRTSSVGIQNNQPVYLNRLVFSEFAANGSAPSVGDFIEIYNASNHTINLENYDLELAFNGVEQPPVPLGAHDLAPGHFFLVATSGAVVAGDADLVLSVPSLPSSLGMRLWHNADPTIYYENWAEHVDRVGSAEGNDGDPATPPFAPAAPAGYLEGRGVLPLRAIPTYETVMRRIGHASAPCIDVGDNSVDFRLIVSGEHFAVEAADPQSMASQPEYCSNHDPQESSTATSLVISEYWPSGYDRFAEEGLTLFNASDIAQPLVGVEVREEYLGATSVVHTFSAADPLTSLLPGQYVLLKRNISTTATADITFTTGLSDAHNGRAVVSLHAVGGATIDEVVFDKISDGTALPPLTNYVERSWVRRLDGCADTGITSADFLYRGARLERSSTSPLQPC